MNLPAHSKHRVLIIDDNAAIHEDFYRILSPAAIAPELDAEAEAFFGAPVAPGPELTGAIFELEFALQGREGRDRVIEAREAAAPFSLAFVDMRMPPGWDGLTTIQKLWEIDPELQVVICTAHSDSTWDEIAATLTIRDRWAVLKKPFDKIEVFQLAHVFTTKWALARKLASAGA